MPSIDIGVIQQFIHPPLGTLTSHLDLAGPYNGVVTLPTWEFAIGTTLNVSDTFGVMWQPNGVIPAAIGRKPGWFDPTGQYDTTIYEQRIVEVVVQHQLASGVWVSDQVVESYKVQDFILYAEALPGRIGLRTHPFINIDLFYLTIL